MKVLAVIPNRDERALLRPMLTSFESPALVGNLDEARVQKQLLGEVDLVLIDERVELKGSGNRGENPPSEEDRLAAVLRFIDEACRKQKHKPLVAVLFAEDASAGHGVSFLEVGMDVILRRPLGKKELEEKVKGLLTLLKSPPPFLKLMRTAYERLSEGKIETVVEALQGLFEQTQGNLHVGLLLSRCYLDLKRPDKAIPVLRLLQQKLPRSPRILTVLREAQEAQNDLAGSFDSSLALAGFRPTEAVFEHALTTAIKFPAEALKAALWRVYENLPRTTEAEIMRYRGLRLRVLREQLQRLGHENEIPKVVEVLKKNADVQDALVDDLKAVAARLPEISESHFLLLSDLVLQLSPGLPAMIERFVQIHIREAKYPQAFEQLERARVNNRLSAEFYAAAARLALAEGLLKEASDNLHAGRRLAPSDERWDELTKVWRFRSEEMSNKGAAAVLVDPSLDADGVAAMTKSKAQA